jgi:hypothetical protein
MQLVFQKKESVSVANVPCEIHEFLIAENLKGNGEIRMERKCVWRLVQRMVQAHP